MTMKKTLLIGLAAVALGGMTACSNILEEEGVISPSAKTGLLTIALEADGSVDVATKATVSTPTDLSSKMKVTATKVENGNTSATVDISYKSVSGDSYIYSSYLNPGEYSVAAKYDEMGNAVLEWNTPIFEGTTNQHITVSKGKEATGTIEAKLQNSQIVIDNTTFSEFCEYANIEKLYVYQGATQPTSDGNKFSMIETNGSLVSDILYVKKEQSNIYIYIKGTLKSGSQPFEVTKLIGHNETEKTEAAIKYIVKYILSADKGSMKITVSINGNVTEQPIEVPVNPYQ